MSLLARSGVLSDHLASLESNGLDHRAERRERDKRVFIAFHFALEESAGCLQDLKSLDHFDRLPPAGGGGLLSTEV